MDAPANPATDAAMSSSLEDYLETIYLLVQDQGFARVKDVAKAREVKAASVSIALRRLAEMDLIRYERREYIALTETGEAKGRRVFSRHRLLTRFFEEILNMPTHAASEQACAMEHSLTDDAMDRLARLFEFLGSCPSIIETFHRTLGAPAGKPSAKPARAVEGCALCAQRAERATASLASLRPGQKAIVSKLTASGALRQRLLDMGVLPETSIELERVGLGGDPLWVRCQGARLALRKSEANSILVHGGK